MSLYAQKDVSFTSEIKVPSVEYLAESTELQAHSLIWFEHREGRITASQFGAVCRSSIQTPSSSLQDKKK